MAKNSCLKMLSILFGLGAIGALIGGCYLVASNEYNHIASLRTVESARDSYKVASCSGIDPALKDQLVYLSCPVTGAIEVLGESVTGFPDAEKGTVLFKTIEVYAWYEYGCEKQATCCCNEGWRRSAEEGLKDNDGDGPNPNLAEIKAKPWWRDDFGIIEGRGSVYVGGAVEVDQAGDPRVGDFALPPFLRNMAVQNRTVSPTCSSDAVLQSDAKSCQAGTLVHEDLLLFRFDLDTSRASDDIGDVRATYSVGSVEHVSLLAKQGSDRSLTPWISSFDDGFNIFLAGSGEESVDDLLKRVEDEWEERSKRIRTWSIILMFIASLFGCIPLQLLGREILSSCSPHLIQLKNLDEIPTTYEHFCDGLVSLIRRFGVAPEFLPLLFVCCMLLWGVVFGATWAPHDPALGVPVLLGAIVLMFVMLGGLLFLNRGDKFRNQQTDQRLDATRLPSQHEMQETGGGEQESDSEAPTKHGV